jgi:hypothetical protein
MLHALRRTVSEAQHTLRKSLSEVLETGIPLETLRKESEAMGLETCRLGVKDIVNKLFQGKGVLADDGPRPVESECFAECVHLLKATTKIMAEAYKATSKERMTEPSAHSVTPQRRSDPDAAPTGSSPAKKAAKRT